MSKEAILYELYQAVVEGDVGRVKEAARRSLKAGLPPLLSVERGLAPGLRQVGDLFGRKEVFLPEMMLAANAMQAGLAVLEPYFGQQEVTRKAKILIGSVQGDIHDIGKGIAATLLRVHGYEVIDLGRDVPAVQFVDEAAMHGADIIGLSGLLTTSLPMMREVIALLAEAGVRDRYKIIIGGGATSQQLADRIGADGYAETAQDGVLLCDRLTSR